MSDLTDAIKILDDAIENLVAIRGRLDIAPTEYRYSVKEDDACDCITLSMARCSKCHQAEASKNAFDDMAGKPMEHLNNVFNIRSEAKS